MGGRQPRGHGHRGRERAGVAPEWVKWLVWARKLSRLCVCINQGSHSCKEQTLHSFETGSCRRKTHYEHAGHLVGPPSGWEPGLGRTGTPSFALPVHVLLSVALAAPHLSRCIFSASQGSLRRPTALTSAWAPSKRPTTWSPEALGSH